jgi:hypothetical protein
LVDDLRWVRLLDHLERLYQDQPDRDVRVAEAFVHLHRIITDEDERSGR